tara:strand:+ start:2518 stop:3504 length:987 start_codon:yes stop_codon:yes gene_type:complete
MNTNYSQLLEMYKIMVKIRLVETKVMKLFEQSEMPGFIHSYIGEEAVAAGICFNLNQKDMITSTHRGHGHLIAKGCKLDLFFAELYGKSTGYCKGKGGSMHVADLDLGILGANGIVGAGAPIASGAALSMKMKNENNVAIAFVGDGAVNIGPFHESLNLASVWALPVIFVVENNGFADFIRTEDHLNIDKISKRAGAYGMQGHTVDGNNVEEVYEVSKQAILNAKNGKGPSLIECVTYRHRGHYEGDPQPYRTKEEVDEWKKKDPIKHTEKILLNNNILNNEIINSITDEINSEIENAVNFAKNSLEPELDESLTDIYTDLKERDNLA